MMYTSLFRLIACVLQDVSTMVEELLSAGAVVSAAVIGLSCWYTRAHEEVVNALFTCGNSAVWTSNGDVMDLLLARIPLSTLLRPRTPPVAHTVPMRMRMTCSEMITAIVAHIQVHAPPPVHHGGPGCVGPPRYTSSPQVRSTVA